MKISFSLEASSVLKDIELYFESLNTKGSGQRFIRKFRQSIKSSRSQMWLTNFAITKHWPF